MDDLAGQGTAILVVSSELPELIGMCDRVLVLCEGVLVRGDGTLVAQAVREHTTATPRPGWFDPDARGLVLGLTLRHGRGHLYRAALEGTAFGVRHNLAAMAAAGGDARRLVAVGGGARELWTQIVSDVTGKEQQLPRHLIGAAYGDAFLAAVGAGLAAPAGIAAWNPVESTVTPDPAAAQVYEELYALYLDLYPATKAAAHALAAR